MRREVERLEEMKQKAAISAAVVGEPGPDGLQTEKRDSEVAKEAANNKSEGPAQVEVAQVTELSEKKDEEKTESFAKVPERPTV